MMIAPYRSRVPTAHVYALLQALSGIARAQEEDEDRATWSDVFFPRDPVTRRMIFCGMGIAFFSQATGTEAAVYYTPTILKYA